MSTLIIKLDDDLERLVAQAAQAADKPVDEWARESVREAAAHAVSVKPVASRVSPLHPHAMTATPDFDSPLEEFEPYV